MLSEQREMINHLQKNIEIISERWIERVYSALPRYKNDTRENLENNIKKDIECMADYLDGNYDSTDNLVKNIAIMRAEKGFYLFESTQGLLIGRDVIMEFLTETNFISVQKITDIDNWFFYTIILHAQIQNEKMFTDFGSMNSYIKNIRKLLT